MGTNCDLYCRVSTTEQAVEGYSLQEQEQRLRAYAAAQGWTVHACYIDAGLSGAKLDRPGLQQIIQDAEAGRVQKVCTYKLDRLSRSQRDTLYLIEDVFLAHGVDYVSMTESFDTASPVGRAVLGLLAVFAQLEREQIKERMTMGRVAAAKEGRWRGGSGVPIGYRYTRKTADADGALTVDPYEADVVREVFRQFLQGKTYNAIYAYCRDHYVTSYGQFAGGGAALIPAMLSNRAYIGEIKYAGKWYAGRHDPIIDAETFRRAQDRLAEYRAALDDHRRQPYRADHLLTGLLYCGECSARWCYHSCRYTKKSGETKIYGTYTCYTKNAHKAQRRAERCSIPVWPAEDLEEIVWSQVLALRYEDIEPEAEKESAELQAVRDRLAAVDRQRSRLVDLYTLGSLPVDLLQEKADALNTEREKLLRQLDALESVSAHITPEELADTLAKLQTIHDNGTPEAQRDVLRVLIRRIVLHPERRVVIEWNI